MLKREYSLKTRYNFSKVFKYGSAYNGKYLLIKYLKVDQKIFESERVKLKFGVVTSNKLTKKKVFHNKIRRTIFAKIKDNFGNFREYYYYVFVPKKAILEELDKGNISNLINEDLLNFLKGNNSSA